MRKVFLFLFSICALFVAAESARCAVIVAPRGTEDAAWAGDIAPNATDYVSPSSYNVMRPFLGNKMAADLRPRGTGAAPDPAPAYARIATGTGITPASAYAKPKADARSASAPAAPQQRRVVARSAVGGATGASVNSARAAIVQGGAVVAQQRGGAKSATPQSRRVVARAGRADNSAAMQNAGNAAVLASSQFVANVSAEQCLADYTNCMNGYCRRESALYNRCYCSPKLAQIDSEFQPAINAALERLMYLQNGGSDLSDARQEEAWNEIFGGGASGNSLAGLNSALSNIEWPAAEDRVRGQNAFATGHEYCAQHLAGCYYMASNMKSVYRSEIARDCAAYESYLEKLKIVAESAVRQLEE
ncbi:MAG: hypothetical protein LBK26_02785 [Rickettsiales bacterium]|jgi:hypothetical protein|nr:hypothetical protein [Rickettsiales bacterium]